ncbi:MAG: TonB family protein [Alphaproteobacteria bacterium]|nr:TonB family protein [Alphaproteobacteria bacterium]
MQQRHVDGYYLNNSHFSAMLVAAVLAHMAAFLVYMILPKDAVTKIPVHVLNVKLGGGDMSTLSGASGPGEMLSPRVMESVEFQPQKPSKSAVTVPEQVKPVKKVVPKPVKAPEVPKAPEPMVEEAASEAVEEVVSHAPVNPYAAASRPSQYVRSGVPGATGQGGGQGYGVGYGNSVSADAEVMQRYTQQISLWVNRHKSLFTSKLQPGMKGNIIVRLQIDRAGNIRQFKLDKATGVPAADAAAMAMVRAANPVPPVPRNHPGGNLFEFLISVNYAAPR